MTDQSPCIPKWTFLLSDTGTNHSTIWQCVLTYEGHFRKAPDKSETEKKNGDKGGKSA